MAEKGHFSNRIKTYYIPDAKKNTTAWFSVDFTLQELKTLRKKQSRDYRDQTHNGKYNITTLEEFIQVAKKSKRKVGLHIETKAPTWVNSLPFMNGTTMEDLVIETLRKHGFRNKKDPCFLQSFSEQSLLYMKNKTDLPLVMLLNEKSPWTIEEVQNKKLQQWSKLFYGIGPWKDWLIQSYSPVNKYKNYLGNETELVRRAHKWGLKVHTFTFRNEDRFLAWDYGQDSHKEYQKFLRLGVDGFFTDFPLTLNSVLRAYGRRPRASRCTNDGTSDQTATFFHIFFLFCLNMLSNLL